MSSAGFLEAIPLLGPLFNDAQFRWWLLCVLVAIGPVPEDVPKPGGEKGETITKWKMGGMLRVLMTAAASHARLADRVGQLEDAFERFGKEFTSFTAELRAIRESRSLFGPVASATVDTHAGAAGGSVVVNAAACDSPVTSIRKPAIPTRA